MSKDYKVLQIRNQEKELGLSKDWYLGMLGECNISILWEDTSDTKENIKIVIFWQDKK